MAKVNNSHNLTIRESRAIIKYNIKQMKYYEGLKKRKLLPHEYQSTMVDENNIIEIDNLETSFFTDNGTVKSVNGVSFNIPKGKIIGVVGESGCGKSVTSLSIMQLVQSPQGQIVGGEIRFNSDDLGYDENGKKLAYNLAKIPTKEMFKVRGKDITMIFAVYEDGVPVHIATKEYTVSGDRSLVYTIPADVATNEDAKYEVKVMMWDDLEGIKPLNNAISY